MNEIQIYSTIMFFAGVTLSQAIFYFDKKAKKKKFYIYLSAAILQILHSVHSVHLGAVEFAAQQLKNLEEDELQEYLEKESQKVLLFMELYVLVFIKAVPRDGRKYINYSTWSEAQALIEKMRGFMHEGDNS